MPIRINLLAEAQAAEESRRKNPVKRGIWLGSFLVSLMLLWIVNLQLGIHFEQKNYNSMNAEWQTQITNYSIVTNEDAKIGEIGRKLAQLECLSTNRFLWGPVLNALQQTTIDQVQVTQIKCTQLVGHEDAHDAGVGTNVQHLKAGMVEKISLSITAKDLKPDAKSYNEFKKRLSTFDFFATHLQQGGFSMGGMLGPLTPEPLDSNKQFRTFSVVAQFLEARHDE
jgi:hypothetical protein